MAILVLGICAARYSSSICEAEARLTGEIELVTVTSHDFAMGTKVMLDSFLRHNRWFSGQIVVVHDDLTDEMVSELESDFSDLRCRKPHHRLVEALNGLTAHVERLHARRRRFYSLDIFFREAATKAIFCDSDMLFCGDISEALKASSTIAAVGDRAQLAGNARHKETLLEYTPTNHSSDFRTFNAGLMVLAPEARSEAKRDEVLQRLKPEAWQKIASDHTDQAVLNLSFGHEVELLDPTFNRLLGHGGALAGRIENNVETAKVLHFNGPAKPWRIDRHLQRASIDPDYTVALRKWNSAAKALRNRVTSSGGL